MSNALILVLLHEASQARRAMKQGADKREQWDVEATRRVRRTTRPHKTTKLQWPRALEQVTVRSSPALTHLAQSASSQKPNPSQSDAVERDMQ